MGRRGVLVVGAAVAVAAVVTGVLLWPGDEPVAQPPPAPLLKPLRLADHAAWHGPADVTALEDDGQVVLFKHDEGMTLVDGRTGAQRWTVTGRDDLGEGRDLSLRTAYSGPAERHLVRDGVLVEYEHGPGGETGVALLSRDDGHVVWRTPVITSFPGEPAAGHQEQILRVADDRVAVVTVTTAAVREDYAAGTARTVAIDVPTGKVLWDRADGTWPMYILGDAVLGVKSGGYPTTEGRDPVGTVVATDLRTGEQRWVRADSGIMAGAGEVVVLRGGGENPVLSAADGREVTRFENVISCESDLRTVFACSVGTRDFSSKIVTFDVAHGKPGAVLQDRGLLEAVWDGGRIVLSGGTGQRDHSVDVNGTLVDEDLNPHLTTVTGDRAYWVPERDGPVEVVEAFS